MSENKIWFGVYRVDRGIIAPAPWAIFADCDAAEDWANRQAELRCGYTVVRVEFDAVVRTVSPIA